MEIVSPVGSSFSYLYYLFHPRLLPPGTRIVDRAYGQYLFPSLYVSEKEMDTSFFFINRRPNEPGPQLLAMAEEAF